MRHSSFDIATHQGVEWLVNGKSVDNDVGEHLNDRTSLEISSWGSSACPYCKIPLRSKDFVDVVDGNEIWHNNRLYASQRGLDHRIGHFRPYRRRARWRKRLTMRTSWRSSVAQQAI
jgi:hypothetical protein